MRPTPNLLTANLSKPNPLFVGATGVELELEDGRRILDAVSGVGVTCLGYGDDRVVAAMFNQATTLQYTHALRFDTPPLRHLVREIASVTPGTLNQVYLVSGGSEAIESALKYARQYWLERDRPGKWKAVGRWPSFHGNTLFAQSVGWHRARRARHLPMLTDLPHIEAPNSYRGCGHCRPGARCTLACAEELERTIVREGAETIACFIVEPIGGAATGAVVPHDDYFPMIRGICDRHEILLIADEVITGFGRTGRWFAMEHWNVDPDMIVFGKGIGGGYAPLAGFAASDATVAAFRSGTGRFEHNFTYAGHAVACAAGGAVLETLKRDRLVERVETRGPTFLRTLSSLLDCELVGDVRGRGFLAAIELVADKQAKTPFDPSVHIADLVSRAALAEGLLVYPSGGGFDGAGDHLLLMPAFVTPDPTLDDIAKRLRIALDRVAGDFAQQGAPADSPAPAATATLES